MSIADTTDLEKRARYVALCGWFTLLIIYTIVFRVSGESEVLPALRRAFINVVPAVILTFPVLYFVQNTAIDRPVWQQIVLHIALGTIFSALWYAGVQAGYGLRDGWITQGLTGRPLIGIALTWQLFQGVTLYAVVALFGYARTYRLRLAVVEARLIDIQEAAPESSAPQAQIIVKDGRSLIPVAISDIFAITGAGDYSEVYTRNGRYLSNSTMSQFEDLLPSDNFLRVHRSHIVKLDAIVSIESGGNGRLSLHLPDSISIVSSRAGAKLIRERAL